jgi:energy-coupling factor transporter ATP-binding protein EcfA2
MKTNLNSLNEQITRIKSMMGILTEEEQEKEIVLIDGTSSAGKSKTAKILNAVPFYESNDSNQWVQIDSDMFGCEDEQCIQNRIKYDHSGDGPNPQAGEEFHKEMSEKRKGGFGENRGDTTVGFHLHPHNKDLIKGVDSRNWYMAQEVKYGGHNKIILDDIGNGILQYLPNENIKNVLLHAPIYILLKNVGSRKETEPRDPKEVLKQYLEKYEATNQKPDITQGDPTTKLTKDSLIGLLKSNGLDDEYINDFLNKLGVDGDGVYYIKVKDSYMTPTTKLINVDSERTVYLNKFKDIVK